MVKSFANPLPHSILARFTGTLGIIRGKGNSQEILFSPLGCLIITCPE